MFQFVLTGVALYAGYGAILHMYNPNLAFLAIKFKGESALQARCVLQLPDINMRQQAAVIISCGNQKMWGVCGSNRAKVAVHELQHLPTVAM